VEEHESAGIIQIISNTKIGEVGLWGENRAPTAKQLTAEPTRGYRWYQLDRTQPLPAPEKMLSSNTHTLQAQEAASLHAGSNAQYCRILQFAHGITFASEANDDDARIIAQNCFVDSY
jgi:hypothetical protein